MKNTELVQVKNIMDYKEELNKVKKLTKDKYTVAEAAEYFGCTKSQIKGYHTNYRDIFEGKVTVEGDTGRQKTIINKDGMYLMAILLNKRSRVAQKLFDNVLALIEGQKQLSIDEAAATTATEEEKQTSDINNDKEMKVKSKKENVITFEDLKKKKSKNDDAIECLKFELTEFGPKIEKVKMSKKEVEKELPKELKRIFDEIDKELSKSLNKTNNDLRDCKCPECLEQELLECCHEADMQKLLAESTLDMEVILTERYMKKCEILGVDRLEAAIMIQSSIVDGEVNIDSKILDYLVNEKTLEIEKKTSVLKLSIELLAEEKCESIEEAFTLFAQEMRYVTGERLERYLKDKNYDKLLRRVVVNNEFDYALNVIREYLAQ